MFRPSQIEQSRIPTLPRMKSCTGCALLYNSMSLSFNREQSDREQALDDFKTGENNIHLHEYVSKFDTV